ncbi:MAG: hypothetical protein KGM17_13470 [Sphingomonadales bacterium]|nr:hypothetical protein [Sphingomonadales bacterium]
MARVSVATVAQAPTVAPAEAHAHFRSGGGITRRVVGGDRVPLRLHLHELAAGDTLTLAPPHHAIVVNVWTGPVTAGPTILPAGSTALVERGGSLSLVAQEPARVLVFTSASPGNACSEGRVHLLPADRVPRCADLGGSSGVGGGMHADASMPTCPVWLHENTLPGLPPDTLDSGAGVHCHSEDEIIFVIDGEIRLGNRISGPGTALFIAAGTMYAFLPGPAGLHFINFRAARPGDIRFARGQVVDEVAYWADRLPRPQYL